ncbi:hypothetical protein HD554DRAFT_2124169 [Boletus coccyginus]|nr:hypothetical protein HD554DRAFT_2124169 [Boletus coccyginus]
MQLFNTVLSLVLLAGSALAQSTQITFPPPGSTLTAAGDTTVQVYMGGYPENIDVVAIVIGLSQCLGGECYPASSYMGSILYQGPYTPQPGNYYANYTVTVPQSFPVGEASLNVINFFMVGASYVPVVDYLNENVTVVA